MEPQQVIEDRGGIATRAELLARVTEASLRRALSDGTVVRCARGRYTLPSVPWSGEFAELRELAEAGRRAAHEVAGTAVLLTAAARWGWETKWAPTRPQVAVPSGRRLSATSRRRIDVRYLSVPADECEDGWVTNRVRTAVDCASLLPHDEALAVIDSALREGMVTRDELLLAAARRPVRYRKRAESIIRMGNAKAANPFESVLRWIASGIPGLHVEPQLEISDVDGLIGFVDLGDEELRIVLEADSFEWHGTRKGHDKDCGRYDRLTAAGWLVLRFTWDMVMRQPERVRELIVRTMAQRDSRV